MLENDEYKMLWDFDIKIDKVIKERRPDIVIIKKKTREPQIIDVAVPGDARVASKEIEKLTKYQDLSIELQKLWEMRKVKVVPIVIRAIGAVPEGISKYLKEININNVKVKHLQRTAILGTAYILRRYLNIF